MHLQSNESIIKTFHHHYFIFLVRALKMVVISVPFFLVATFFRGTITDNQLFLVYFAIGFIFAALIAYDLIIFYADRLIVTNKRIVYVDWQGIFQRSEHEAELSDIQDIATKEVGLLSYLPIFDFGSFGLETSSSSRTISFTDAPDPEGIKDFIYHLDIKPNKIHVADNSSSHDHARHADAKIKVGAKQ